MRRGCAAAVLSLWLAAAAAFSGDVPVAALPPEARATLALIVAGGPFPYPRIVAGRSGERYYTGDHYRSFRRIIQ